MALPDTGGVLPCENWGFARRELALWQVRVGALPGESWSCNWCELFRLPAEREGIGR